MNDEQAFERYVADNVASQTGGTLLPDDFYDDLREYTDSHRQPPRWLALIKEPPMRTSNQLAVGSPSVRVAAIVVATVLLLAALAGAGVAGQLLLAADDTIVVAQDGSGHYETITDAVDQATDGDAILVRPGTYDEAVIITKDITLRGDGERDEIVLANSQELSPSALVNSPDLPVAFRFEGSDATIENLTLRGESSRVEIRGGSPTLQDIHFDDIGRVFGVDPGSPSVPAGVDVQDESTASITDSTFTGSTIVIHSASSPQVLRNDFVPGAIYMDGVGTDPVIEANSITGAGSFHAVTAWGGARPEIRGNTISSERDAVNVRDAGFPSSDRGPWPTIVENTIMDSARGIQIASGAGADIVGNILAGNAMGIAVAISDVTVDGNTITGGLTGIQVSGSSPSVTGNTVEGAERGLVIDFGSAPTLEGNTICGNVTNLAVNANAEPPDTAGNEICEDAPAE